MVVTLTAITGSPASDLALASDELVDRLEEYMGWDSPTVANSAWALERLNDGYRRALRGEHISGGQMAYHQWAFLRPIAQLTVGGAQTGTASGVAATNIVTATTAIFDVSMVGLTMTVTDVGDLEISGFTSTTVVTVSTLAANFATKAVSVESTGIVALPSDFGGILRPPVLQFASAKTSPELVEVSPESVQRDWRDSNSLAPPEKYAQVSLTFTAATGQRHQLWVSPIPDESRVLRYRYRVHEEPLTDATTYPVGGPDFTDVVLEAGMAACESSRNILNGPHEVKYQQMVQAAIEMDAGAYSSGDAPESAADSDNGLEA